ncbi:MAG TPA: hypothetical protein VJJ23_02540 [Candidatus Nanoarchaeia archaeon]|nr:hypothetical protein [Candidatus Nanoarchaeia archaeon]
MEQETFNAIIEGEYSYKDRKAPFKYTILPEISGDIARINIPEKYLLYGKTNFKTLDKITEKNLRDKELSMSFLEWCDNDIILYRENGEYEMLQLIEKAAKMIPQEEIDRIIFTRDGRIFVRDFCLSDHDYLNNIHFMLEKIGKMFNDKDIDTAYKELRSLMKL